VPANNQSTICVLPPTASTPPQDLMLSTCVAYSLGSPVFSSTCGLAITVTNDAPAVLPLGTTTVTWTAEDSDGGRFTTTQRVTAILGDDPSCCPQGSNKILGSSGPDLLFGTSGVDCILGRGGIDIIDGRAGNDFLSGGEGPDQLTGREGSLYISGGNGNDVINGGDQVGTLLGGAGNDIVFGGDAADNIDLGPGSDQGYGGGGDDVIHGRSGNDHIRGGFGNDELYGDEDDAAAPRDAAQLDASGDVDASPVVGEASVSPNVCLAGCGAPSLCGQCRSPCGCCFCKPGEVVTLPDQPGASFVCSPMRCYEPVETDAATP
jgi:Ca2+-binding RTX toxin-like protein